VTTGVQAGPAGILDGVPAAGRAGVPAGVLVLRAAGLAGLLLLVLGGAGSLAVGFFEQRREEVRPVADAFTTLDVDSGVGDVTVRTGPAGSRASVTTTLRWAFVEPTATTTVAGGTLRLRGDCSQRFTGLSHCSVDFTVTVPAGTTVRVVTTSGDVTVAGATAEVDARTTAGDIRMTSTRSARVQAQTAAGDVRLQFAAVPDAVRARTTAGDITVLLPPGGPAYRVVTTRSPVGERRIGVGQDPASSHVIDVAATVGDVVVAPGGAGSSG
jgi:Putative adhesin